MRMQEGVKEAALPSTHFELQRCAPSLLEQGRRKEQRDVKWAGPPSITTLPVIILWSFSKELRLLVMKQYGT